MKINVPDFLEAFVKEPTRIDVVVKLGSTNMIYVGCPDNWGAFMERMNGFKETTEVSSVSADGGKLVVSVNRL